MRIHEYDDPALGATRGSMANETAMHSMSAESDVSASGENAPAAATTGPIVDASEYAGPIDADARTETSKNRSTLGRRCCVCSSRGLATATNSDAPREASN